MIPASGIYVVFDGPPGPVAGRFVETENERGEGVGPATTGAQWTERDDGYWVLGPFTTDDCDYCQVAGFSHAAPVTPTEGTTMTITYVGLVQRGEILQQHAVAEGGDHATVEKIAREKAAELNAGQEPDGFELAWKAATLPVKT